MTAYRVRVIGEGRPGGVLRTLHSLRAAREWIARTGVAYDWEYGVCIQRCHSDAFDCGDGRFVHCDDAWEQEQ